MNVKLFIQIIALILFVFICILVVQYFINKPSTGERLRYQYDKIKSEMDARDEAVDDFIKTLKAREKVYGK